jgi:hypothetical protein
MPLFNMRITASERIKLKALAQSSGFKSLSAFGRHQMGLNPEAPGESDAVPDRDVVDLEHILPILTFQQDQLKEIVRTMKRIAKHLGVETEAAPFANPSKPSKIHDADYARG